MVSRAILTLLSLLSWFQAEKQGCLQFCIVIHILSIWQRAQLEAILERKAACSVGSVLSGLRSLGQKCQGKLQNDVE